MQETKKETASSIESRVQDILKRHPKVPKDVADKMRAAKTGGEVKRTIKAWLAAQPNS